MKVCNICKVEKHMDEFHNMTASKDGKDRRCKDCIKERDHQRYLACKEYVRIAKNNPCITCGSQYEQRMMDFHHRDPSQKQFNIGRRHGTMSLSKLKSEIEKCDLLCKYCHGDIHYGSKRSCEQS